MAYNLTRKIYVKIEIDDEAIIEAINAGEGISFGTLAIEAVRQWSEGDLDGLRYESLPEEIAALERILRAMKGAP